MATKYSNTIKIKTGQGDTGFEDVKISYIGKNSTTEEGIGTKAVIAGQHVEGKYNQPVSAITSNGKTNNVLHVAGNGTDDENRSNAYILTEGGEGVYAGGIVTTNVLLTSSDEVEKLLNGDSYPDVDKTTSLNETLGEFAETLQESAQNLEQYNAQYNKFVNETYKDYTVKIEQQMDGGGNTWYYSEAQMNAEMATWNTNALKNEHVSDLWYNTGTNKSYIYTTKHEWSEVTQGISQALFDTADSKARLFTERPCNDALKVTQAYNVNDLWILNVDNPEGVQAYYPPYREGTLLVATAAKAIGATYSPNDWTEKVKYSDEIANLQNQVDRRLETWFQSTAPEFRDEEKNNHVGDYWFDTKTEKIKKYILNPDTNRYEWAITDDTISRGLFDLTDGKSTVYTVIDANTAARQNDLLIPTSNFTYNNVKYSIGKVYRYSGSAWDELAYTDVQGVKDNGGIFTGQTIGNKTASTQIREDGVLYATGANITGTITATSGEFTGDIKCGVLQGTANGCLTSEDAFSKTADDNPIPVSTTEFFKTTDNVKTTLDKGYLHLENTTLQNQGGEPTVKFDNYMYPYYNSMQALSTDDNDFLIMGYPVTRAYLNLYPTGIILGTYPEEETGRNSNKIHFDLSNHTLKFKPIDFDSNSSTGLVINKDGIKWNNSAILTKADASTLSVNYATTASNATSAESATTAASCTGNAATATSATKATQDGNGNVITSTYLPLAGGTMKGALNMGSNDFSTRKITFYNGNSWIDDHDGSGHVRFAFSQNNSSSCGEVILTTTGIFRPHTKGDTGNDLGNYGANAKFQLGKSNDPWWSLYVKNAHIQNSVTFTDKAQARKALGIATDSLTSVSVGANASTEKSVTFPTGTFDSVPTVVASLQWNPTSEITSGAVMVSVHSVTKTGFKIEVFNSSESDRTPNINWIAIE